MTVSNHLYEFQVFHKALTEFVAKKSHLDKLTIAFKKPQPKSSQQKLFKQALKEKSSFFDSISVEEVDDFTQAVQSEQYHKFSEVFAEEL